MASVAVLQCAPLSCSLYWRTEPSVTHAHMQQFFCKHLTTDWTAVGPHIFAKECIIVAVKQGSAAATNLKINALFLLDQNNVECLVFLLCKSHVEFPTDTIRGEIGYSIFNDILASKLAISRSLSFRTRNDSFGWLSSQFASLDAARESALTTRPNITL